MTASMSRPFLSRSTRPKDSTGRTRRGSLCRDHRLPAFSSDVELLGTRYFGPRQTPTDRRERPGVVFSPEET